MKISILGSGWLGLPLAKELQALGHQLKLSTRSIERLEEIEQELQGQLNNQIESENAQVYLYDIEALANDREFLNSELLIVNITSKNIEAFDCLITDLEQSSIKNVLFISSTSVYQDFADANHKAISEDQTDALKPCPLLTIEKRFQKNNHFQTSIIRFAGLIGYQRHPGKFFVQHRENGSIKTKGIRNPDAQVNMIHRDDCIGMILHLIDKACWGEVFNGCSSHHPSRREFYSHAIKDFLKLKTVAIEFIATEEQHYKTIANDKVKAVLGYQFKMDNLFAINYP
jgi:nucleoside-diphosphate-sugar epimerase